MGYNSISRGPITPGSSPFMFWPFPRLYPFKNDRFFPRPILHAGDYLGPLGSTPKPRIQIGTQKRWHDNGCLVGGFSPTHLKNMHVKMGIFPKYRGENKKCLSCHHLVVNNPLPSLKLTFIAPENGWLEDDFPFGFRLIFRCELLVLGRVIRPYFLGMVA